MANQATWTDSTKTMIRLETVNGTFFVPDNANNAHRAEITKSGGTIADYQPVLANAKQRALDAIAARFELCMSNVYAQYPQSIVHTWPEQLTLARALIGGATLPPGNLLAALAAGRAGILPASLSAGQLHDFATKIIAHAQVAVTELAKADAIAYQAQKMVAAETNAAQIAVILARTMKQFMVLHGAP